MIDVYCLSASTMLPIRMSSGSAREATDPFVEEGLEIFAHKS